jgi:hypothetical protein
VYIEEGINILKDLENKKMANKPIENQIQIVNQH